MFRSTAKWNSILFPPFHPMFLRCLIHASISSSTDYVSHKSSIFTHPSRAPHAVSNLCTTTTSYQAGPASSSSASSGFSEKTDFAWVPASILLAAMRESRNRSTRKVVVKLGGCRYLRLFHKVGSIGRRSSGNEGVSDTTQPETTAPLLPVLF